MSNARAALALTLGDPDAALRHLDDGGHVVRRAPAQLGWHRLREARALLAIGRTADARSELDRARRAAEDHRLPALLTAIEQIKSDDAR